MLFLPPHRKNIPRIIWYIHPCTLSLQHKTKPIMKKPKRRIRRLTSAFRGFVGRIFYPVKTEEANYYVFDGYSYNLVTLDQILSGEAYKKNDLKKNDTQNFNNWIAGIHNQNYDHEN